MEYDGLLLKVMPSHAVTLTFGPENLNSMSPGQGTCDLMLVKLDLIVTKILYSPIFQVIACCDLDL